MKKALTILAVVAVAAVATADLAYFKIDGGKLFDAGDGAVPAGAVTGGFVIQFTDLTLAPSYLNSGGTQIDIAEIGALFAVMDVAVGPAFTGGKYSTLAFSERPSAGAGQEASIVFDLNGGGIAVGDFVGISAFTIQDMAAEGSPAPADPQFVTPGDITGNVEVIPEPATFGLMGIAGLGMFLARKKARR